MTVETMTIGSYLALVILGFMSAWTARIALAPLGSRGTIKPVDVGVLVLYMLGVVALVSERDILLEDLLLRASVHVAFLAYGWWRCLTDASVQGPVRRLVLLSIIVPLVSGWACVGWFLRVDSFPRLLFLLIAIAALLGPVALICNWVRRRVAAWSQPDFNQKGTAANGLESRRSLVAAVVAALAIMWLETRPVDIGDPFNEASLSRAWARWRLGDTSIADLQSWLERYADKKVPAGGVERVDPRDWPAALRALQPLSVHVVNGAAISVEWPQIPREPRRTLLVYKSSHPRPTSDRTVRVRDSVYARYGSLQQ
jgi:hypothetical protein